MEPDERLPYLEARGVVSERDAREELERVLSDPEFHCTERNKNFLRFVAEEFLQGRESAVKAYTIAVDVFGRPPSFDPSTDPIVRIEATRLRASLANYYERHHRTGGVRIDLPKGRYIPVFSRVGAESDDIADLAPSRGEQAVRLPTHRGVSRRQQATTIAWPSVPLSMAIGVLIAGLFFLAVSVRTETVISEKPSVFMEMALTEGPSDAEAIAFRDGLVVALSRFQSFRLMSPDIASRDGNAAEGSPEAYREHRYHLLLKYNRNISESSILWQVIDPKSGETVRSGVEGFHVGYSPSEAVAKLASHLAAPRGVINSIETVREVAHPTLGNGCILRAYLAMDAGEITTLSEARACLEKTLELRPSDADAYAALAAVLLKTESKDAGRTELIGRAAIYADLSVALASDSDRAHFARMLVQFRMGNQEAAILAGRRAMALNPHNAAVKARLGGMLFALGRWDEAIPLVESAAQFEDLPVDEVEKTLAFDAYRRGEFGEALIRLQRIGDRNRYGTRLILRAATLAQLGQVDEAAAVVAKLRELRPEFEKSFRSDMANRQLAPSLVLALEAGLTKVGLKFPDTAQAADPSPDPGTNLRTALSGLSVIFSQ